MAHDPGMFCWFECGSTNAATARAFYTALFGWDAVDTPMIGHTGGVYTLFRVDGADIAGLYELAGPQFEGVPSSWMTYVSVDSADESAAKAESLGATIMLAPLDIPEVGRMAFIADPTGACIGMFQLGEHSGTNQERSNLGWAELHTPDCGASKAFYKALFDWAAKEDPSGMYTEWQVAGRSIGGMMSIPDDGPPAPPHWLIYAAVGDCDKTLARAVDLGASIIVPAKDIPDVGRFGVIADPTGAAIAVIRLTEHGQV